MNRPSVALMDYTEALPSHFRVNEHLLVSFGSRHMHSHGTNGWT